MVKKFNPEKLALILDLSCSSLSPGMNSLLIKLSVLIVFGFISCVQAYNQDASEISELLNKPHKIVKLPNELHEISGLSYFKDKKLLCLHDEKADIYMLDYETGEVEKFIETQIPGDYEGIELVNGLIYALKSNGTIHEFGIDSGHNKPVTYKTSLGEKNDTEGLGYDSLTNSLLIACKNKPAIGEANIQEKVRAVYRFSLDTKTLDTEPHILINLDTLYKYHGYHKFMPSAIASHPVKGHLYILSSVGKLLMIIDKEAKIVDVVKLNPSIYTQPEGICFDPEGKWLFISNEGQKSNATLVICKTL